MVQVMMPLVSGLQVLAIVVPFLIRLMPPLIAAWDLVDGETAVLAWAAQSAGFEAILEAVRSTKAGSFISVH